MNTPPFHYPFFYCRSFQLLSSYSLHLHDHFCEGYGTPYVKAINKIRQHRKSRFLAGCKYLIHSHFWSYFYLHDFYDFEYNKRYHFISLALSCSFFNILDFANIILLLEYVRINENHLSRHAELSHSPY